MRLTQKEKQTIVDGLWALHARNKQRELDALRCTQPDNDTDLDISRARDEQARLVVLCEKLFESWMKVISVKTKKRVWK